MSVFYSKRKGLMEKMLFFFLKKIYLFICFAEMKKAVQCFEDLADFDSIMIVMAIVVGMTFLSAMVGIITNFLKIQ